jgi:hypothetical protein
MIGTTRTFLESLVPNDSLEYNPVFISSTASSANAADYLPTPLSCISRMALIAAHCLGFLLPRRD